MGRPGGVFVSTTILSKSRTGWISNKLLVLLVTYHILVLPAEALDGIPDVFVPLEAFVAVIALGRVPGEGALD